MSRLFADSRQQFASGNKFTTFRHNNIVSLQHVGGNYFRLNNATFVSCTVYAMSCTTARNYRHG